VQLSVTCDALRVVFWLAGWLAGWLAAIMCDLKECHNTSQARALVAWASQVEIM
jgi:hypothetical protein